MNYDEVLENGEKVKDWKNGEIYRYEDTYYYLDHDKGEIVMKGNFI